jgi:Na+/H+ antiporter NhaC
MRPLLDSLFVSREKLAFIVDATSAPVASISPISSWVGFEVGLIQAELDKIVDIAGEEALGDIKSTGFGVFLQSIKYRYYPIFMLVFVMVIIFSQRDMGPMLVAERKARVYKITDGGDGKGRGGGLDDENQPEEDTPKKSWNMVAPVLLLIFLIFWLLIQTGTIEGVSQTFMEKIENSDSYSSMLWGTMGAVMCTIIFYLLQIVRDGHLILPRWPDIKLLLFARFMQREEDEEDLRPVPRFLMSVYDSVESLLFGMGRIFPAIIVLALAWASGAVMVDIGADRLFAGWIVGGVPPEMLPTLSFIVALFMALATGTSWGTMVSKRWSTCCIKT